MAAMVAAERHLWLTLSDMKEKDRVVLMDAPLAPSGLFGDAVNSVVDRFQEASKQAAAFSGFSLAALYSRGAGREQPQPCVPAPHIGRSKAERCARAPPQRDRGRQRSRKSRLSETKPDMRVVLQSRKPSMKRSWRLCRTVEGGPYGKSGVHRITRCPSLLSSLWRSVFLPTLPEFQGASGLPRVPFSVLSARKRSGAESLATPSGISRAATSVACRSSVSGHRSSSSKHTRCQSRETGSLSRLFSSVETTAKCISFSVLQTVEKGYRIQFGTPPPPFKGLCLTSTNPEQALVLEQEVKLSSEEGGHRGGPSSRQRESGSTAGTSLFQRRMEGYVQF